MNKYYLISKVHSLLGTYLFNVINYHYLHLRNFKIPPILNLNNPRRFNHKLIFMKLNSKNNGYEKYADKIEVKKHIAKIISSKYLIPTLETHFSPDSIDYDKLPKDFIIKTNHGSGMNILVKDKSKINPTRINKILKKWLNINYFNIGSEYQYKNIKPKIIIEPIIKTKSPNGLVDYKFFCFHGEPKFVQIDIDRFTNHKRNFYDLNWNKLNFNFLYKNSSKQISKPNNFSEMIEISKKLSKEFKFIRVDLYDCDGAIYFGELTFFPGGGFEPIYPTSFDFKLGDMLTIKSK